MNGPADPLVGAAAAEVLRHRLLDVGGGGAGLGLARRRRAHDVPRLAVAALRNLLGDPGLLHRVAPVGRKPLDRRDGFPGDGVYRKLAGLLGDPVDVDGARATLPDAAPELGPGEMKGVAQDPEQRGVGWDVGGDLLAVHFELWHVPLRLSLRALPGIGAR